MSNDVPFNRKIVKLQFASLYRPALNRKRRIQNVWKTLEPISAFCLEYCRPRALDKRNIARAITFLHWRNNEEKKAKLLASGGTHDHIHLYASLPSTVSNADFVNAVKSNSSRRVHESYSNARAFAWQDGYGAFSVSKSQEKRVIKYILEQEAHHRKHDFKKEFVSLLKRNEIEYDLRYLWD